MALEMMTVRTVLYKIDSKIAWKLFSPTAIQCLLFLFKKKWLMSLLKETFALISEGREF